MAQIQLISCHAPSALFFTGVKTSLFVENEPKTSNEIRISTQNSFTSSSSETSLIIYHYGRSFNCHVFYNNIILSHACTYLRNHPSKCHTLFFQIEIECVHICSDKKWANWIYFQMTFPRLSHLSQSMYTWFIPYCAVLLPISMY